MVVSAKSILTGVLVGGLIGVYGAFCKDSVMNNYVMFPEMGNKQLGNPMSYKHDYSMKPERAGYWVRTREEIPAMTERGQV